MTATPRSRTLFCLTFATLVAVATASGCSSAQSSSNQTEKAAYAEVTTLLADSLKAAGVTRFSYESPDPSVETCDGAAGNPDPSTVTLARTALTGPLSPQQQRQFITALKSYWADQGDIAIDASPSGLSASAATKANAYEFNAQPYDNGQALEVYANCFPSDHAYPQTNM